MPQSGESPCRGVGLYPRRGPIAPGLWLALTILKRVNTTLEPREVVARIDRQAVPATRPLYRDALPSRLCGKRMSDERQAFGAMHSCSSASMASSASDAVPPLDVENRSTRSEASLARCAPR